MPEYCSDEMGVLGMSWVNMLASGLVWALSEGAGGGTIELELV